MPDPTRFTVDALEIQRGSRKLVSQLSFSLAPGQVLCLQGPNGAGKTTLLETLVGLRQPAKGRITQENIHGTAYLPEQLPLYPSMTVEEELSLVTEMLLQGHQAVYPLERVLQQFGLRSYQWVVIDHLSRGLQQRVALAQTFLNQAQLLILDDPTLGLDVVGLEYLIQALLEIKEHTIVILSTHDERLLEALEPLRLILGEYAHTATPVGA